RLMATPRAEMTRRRTDQDGLAAATKAHTRTAVRVQRGKAGGRLKTEVVLPVGIGALVMCTAMGLAAAGATKIGAPLPVTLTVAGNTRHFPEGLRRDVQLARENDTPLAVVALDIDGFKKLNDDRGHGHGDEALKLAGEAIERAVRGDDLVARLGGDDFVMIL